MWQAQTGANKEEAQDRSHLSCGVHVTFLGLLDGKVDVPADLAHDGGIVLQQCLLRCKIEFPLLLLWVVLVVIGVPITTDVSIKFLKEENTENRQRQPEQGREHLRI